MENSGNAKITQKDDRQGIYLFGFTRSALIPALEGIGLDGQTPLFLHRFSDITAVICNIALHQFCGPSAESRMKNLSWIGPRACRHEEVVEQMMRHSPVLPARFGTIFSSVESLEKLMRMHHDGISQFLDRVNDKEEWAVKGFLDRKRALKRLRSMTLAGETERLAALSPGMRYFQKKQAVSAAEKMLNRRLKEMLKEIWDDLKPYASDFCERKVLSRDATGMDMDMILNWAFWVAQEDADDFRAGVDKANEVNDRQGVLLQLSGPWPPYSFLPSLDMDD